MKRYKVHILTTTSDNEYVANNYRILNNKRSANEFVRRLSAKLKARKYLKKSADGLFSFKAYDRSGVFFNNVYITNETPVEPKRKKAKRNSKKSIKK